jgi:hypothetical protein
MEPLTNADKQSLLRDNPEASIELIEEYQLLPAEKFTHPIRLLTPPDDRAKIDRRNARIKELRVMLFRQDA